MQEWLNDPKNRPIVFGIAGCVMVAAIVFILFQSGVIAPTQTAYVPPPTGASMPPPSGAPGTAGAPSPTGPPPPSAPGAAAHLPGKTMVASGGAPVASGPASAVPASAGTSTEPALPAVIVSAPNARQDPFEPYINLANYLARHKVPNRPRVDTFAPALNITTYRSYSPATVTVASNPNFSANSGTGQSSSPAASIGRVSGVMLGTGAYAIFDTNGQSVVLQPGENLPNGAGELISIESDSVTVKSNGQFVKVPISSGDSSGAPNANAGPGNAGSG